MQNNNKTNKIPDALNKYLKPKKVVIFSLSYCPYCLKASQLLSNLNIKPEMIYIDKVPSLKNDKDFKIILDKHSNISTFPKIYVGTKCLGGYSDLYDLFTQNKLFEILKKENIDYIEEDYY